METRAYRLTLPDTPRTSVIFASPHSGRDYGHDFLRRSVLDERGIRSSEDAYMDMLFDAAPRFGAPLLAARAPRAYVDLNRGAEELDPALIRGVTGPRHNPRVASGLGVIPRVVSGAREIYRGKLSRDEATARLRDVWYPYHHCLQGLMDDSAARFGNAILIDCHSMPHDAIETLCRTRAEKPEVVLGDRFGASAADEIVTAIEEAFRDEGFRVARNAPFAGAYTAQHYGRPSRGRHVVQIEIDRALYMNERLIRPNGNFGAFKLVIDRITERIAAIGRPGDLRVAAE